MNIGTATVVSTRAVHGLPVARRKRRKDATKLSEREFKDQVIKLAKLYGWRVAHFRPALTRKGWRTAVQGDGAGFPDLVLLRGRVVLAWELKVPPNTTSAAQDEWIDALRYAGVQAQVLYPRQWDWIEEELRTRK